jgi:hypothetical protein
MSSRNVAVSPSGSAARMEGTGAGGAAGIEIVDFPQILYTRTFGNPDTLFVPLLEPRAKRIEWSSGCRATAKTAAMQ